MAAVEEGTGPGKIPKREIHQVYYIQFLIILYNILSEYVDPYVVLASLGFGVFLFNLIYDLLNRSARSIDVSDMNIVFISSY